MAGAPPTPSDRILQLFKQLEASTSSFSSEPVTTDMTPPASSTSFEFVLPSTPASLVDLFKTFPNISTTTTEQAPLSTTTLETSTLATTSVETAAFEDSPSSLPSTLFPSSYSSPFNIFSNSTTAQPPPITTLTTIIEELTKISTPPPTNITTTFASSTTLLEELTNFTTTTTTNLPTTTLFEDLASSPATLPSSTTLLEELTSSSTTLLGELSTPSSTALFEEPTTTSPTTLLEDLTSNITTLLEELTTSPTTLLEELTSSTTTLLEELSTPSTTALLEELTTSPTTLLEEQTSSTSTLLEELATSRTTTLLEELLTPNTTQLLKDFTTTTLPSSILEVEVTSSSNTTLKQLFLPLKDTINSLLDYGSGFLSQTVQNSTFDVRLADTTTEVGQDTTQLLTTTAATTTAATTPTTTLAASTLAASTTVDSLQFMTSPSTRARLESPILAAASIGEFSGPMGEVTPHISQEELAASLDVFFLLTMSLLVVSLAAGLAFLEVGTCRARSSSLRSRLTSLFTSALAFWAVGYMVAYSGGNDFIGFDYRFLATWSVPATTTTIHWFFTFTFCLSSVTIVWGALAGRCQPTTYLVTSVLLAALIYPVAAHAAWTEHGWLRTNGFEDLAGSGVVHLLAGVAGLTGAVILGPRTDGFRAVDAAQEGHSSPLTMLGAFMVLLGMVAKNGSSGGSIVGPEARQIVQTAVINTVIAGAGSAALTLGLFNPRIFNPFQPSSSRNSRCFKKWTLLMTVNSILVGMVAISASCHRVSAPLALLVGVLAGLSYSLLHTAMLWFRVDDPLDTVAVHCGGGVFGLTVLPFVVASGGVFDPAATVPAAAQVWSQVVGVLVITAWAATTSGAGFFLLKLAGKLRLTREQEVGQVKEGMEEDSEATSELTSEGKSSQVFRSLPKRGGANFLELDEKTWKSPAAQPNVKFLGFRKMSAASSEDTLEDKAEMLTGLVNEAFEEDYVDGNKSVSQTKEDGTRETHFGADWKAVTAELETSLNNLQAEKAAEDRVWSSEEDMSVNEAVMVLARERRNPAEAAIAKNVIMKAKNEARTWAGEERNVDEAVRSKNADIKAKNKERSLAVEEMSVEEAVRVLAGEERDLDEAVRAKNAVIKAKNEARTSWAGVVKGQQRKEEEQEETRKLADNTKEYEEEQQTVDFDAESEAGDVALVAEDESGDVALVAENDAGEDSASSGSPLPAYSSQPVSLEYSSGSKESSVI